MDDVTQTDNAPLLYSFRRCPYAMRARMAMLKSDQACQLREVVLRDKPAEMIAVSPKATVPVLVLPDGTVIEESLEIMHWTLAQNDPDNLLANVGQAGDLITENDGPFKHSLDRYKYENRYVGERAEDHRENGVVFLKKLDAILRRTGFLNGPQLSLADLAVFPFVRQFANVNRPWFDSLALPDLQSWLDDRLQSDVFVRAMKKYPQWKTGDENVQFVV